jgi:hypothetical protein
MSRPIVASSARKRGYSDEEIVHALDNAIDVFDLDDGFVMVVGPLPSGALIELGIVQGETEPVVVHAMPARRKYLRR